MKNRVTLFVLFALCCRPLAAQGNSQNQPTTEVTVVLKERFPQEHIAALIRRHPGANGKYVIAIARADATPALLATTLAAVAGYRRSDTTTGKLTVSFPRGVKYPRPQAADVQRMKNAVSELLSAAPRAVPGVGRVPAISVAPPALCATCSN